MSDSNLLTEPEAAEYLRLQPKTLSRWRWAGKGPAYHKIGGAVRYARNDLDRFLVDGRCDTTSEIAGI